MAGPLNFNVCLSLSVAQGPQILLSLQALFPAASVSHVEGENNIYLLKVGRIGDTEAEPIVKIFSNF